jgi:hypothetical protein
LKEKLTITSGEKLRNQILLKRKHIDFRNLIPVVASFLRQPQEAEKIL